MTEANSLVVCTSRATNAPKSSPALGSRHWSRNASSYLIKRHEALAIIENLGETHHALREHLAKGREYFHPNPPVIELAWSSICASSIMR